jgi:hypothetical protein
MRNRTGRLEFARRLLVFLFFGSVFFHLTMPIFDPDFWWHLATGRWMWQHGTLIQEDPFGFVSFEGEEARRGFILKQYWLSQLLCYGVYLLAGFKGIVLLRASVITLMFYFLYRLMRREGTRLLPSLLLVYLAELVIVKEFTYVGGRPQMWTSLFAVLVIYVLEGVKQKRQWAYASLPLLMFFWANMHGGFVLGDIIIATYLAVGLVFRTAGASFVISTVLAMLISGLNPNGYMAFLGVLSTFFNIESAEYWQAITETQSLFQHASLSGIMEFLPFFSGLLVLSLVSFPLNLKRILWEKKELVLIYVLVFVMGVQSIRYIVFFATVASLITAINLGPVMSRWKGLEAKAIFRKVSVVITLALVLLMAGDLAASGYGRTSLKMERPYNSDYEGATDFISQNRLKGRIFNDYTPGGYLIWRLHPDIKVFVDGRALSLRGFDLFREIADNSFRPLSRYDITPLYIRALGSFDIELVVLSGCDKASGVTIPLSYALINDDGWAIVYVDGGAIVFMKDTSETRDFIEKHRLPKTKGYRNILTMAIAASRSIHAHRAPGLKLSFAIAYRGLGEKDKALRWIGEYLRVRPNDGFAVDLKRMIERM